MTLFEFLLAFLAALIAAIPPTLLAYSAFQQSTKNAVTTKENTDLTAATQKEVVAASVKLAAVEKQTEQIHTATNGASEKMEKKFDAVTAEAAELRKIIKALVDSAAVAAPLREDTHRQTGEVLAKVTRVEESDGLLGNGNITAFMKVVSELAKEVKKTQALVTNLIAEREPLVDPSSGKHP